MDTGPCRPVLRLRNCGSVQRQEEVRGETGLSPTNIGNFRALKGEMTDSSPIRCPRMQLVVLVPYVAPPLLTSSRFFCHWPLPWTSADLSPALLRVEFSLSSPVQRLKLGGRTLLPGSFVRNVAEETDVMMCRFCCRYCSFA